jgi:hypothetical protein
MKTYVDGLVTAATDAKNAGTLESDFTTSKSGLGDAKTAIAATAQGTLCTTANKEKIVNAYADLNTKSLAYSVLLDAETALL